MTAKHLVSPMQCGDDDAGRSSWAAIKGLLAPPRRASSFGASSKAVQHAAEDSRCFSVLAASQSLHLELPREGNGRSRREWMDAIAGLDGCCAAGGANAVTGDAVKLGAQRKRTRTSGTEP